MEVLLPTLLQHMSRIAHGDLQDQEDARVDLFNACVIAGAKITANGLAREIAAFFQPSSGVPGSESFCPGGIKHSHPRLFRYFLGENSNAAATVFIETSNGVLGNMSHEKGTKGFDALLARFSVIPQLVRADEAVDTIAPLADRKKETFTQTEQVQRVVRGDGRGKDRGIARQLLRDYVQSVALRDGKLPLLLDAKGIRILEGQELTCVSYVVGFSAKCSSATFPVTVEEVLEGEGSPFLRVSEVTFDGAKCREQLQRIKKGDTLSLLDTVATPAGPVLTSASAFNERKEEVCEDVSKRYNLVLTAGGLRTVRLWPSHTYHSPVVGEFDDLAERSLDTPEKAAASMKKVQKYFNGMNSGDRHTAATDAAYKAALPCNGDITEEIFESDAIRGQLERYRKQVESLAAEDDAAKMDALLVASGLDHKLQRTLRDLRSRATAGVPVSVRDLAYHSGVSPVLADRWFTDKE